jgi:hypothetical protein
MNLARTIKFSSFVEVMATFCIILGMKVWNAVFPGPLKMTLKLSREGSGLKKDRVSARQGFVFLAVIMAALAGCASSEFAQIKSGLEDRGHYIEQVPFYRHEENWCGPAALAAVTGFWGRRMSLEQISSKVNVPQLRGTLPVDMEFFLKDTGFETKSVKGSLDELKLEILKNIPVISLVDRGRNHSHQPHYIIVIGFDESRKAIIAHDGMMENNIIAYDTFMREWSRAGRWMLIAVPGTILTRAMQ